VVVHTQQLGAPGRGAFMLLYDVRALGVGEGPGVGDRDGCLEGAQALVLLAKYSAADTSASIIAA
jgi:hypothetical protein